MKDNNSMAEVVIWCDSCGDECDEGFESVGQMNYCPICWENILAISHLDFVRKEGGVAHQAGIPLTENPYYADRSISDNRAWAAGWADEDQIEKSEG